GGVIPTRGHEDTASSEFGVGPVRSSEKQRGRIATMIKGAFKIYLVPAMQAQNALATVTGGWNDLVTEARREREADMRTDALREPAVEPAVAAPASAAPVTEPGEPRRST